VTVLLLALAGIAWVGHAALWTAVMNHLYGRPLNKYFLKLWRLFTGLVILAFPLLFFLPGPTVDTAGWVWDPAFFYFFGCWLFGGIVFSFITIMRLLRPKPPALASEHTTTHDFWPALGEAARGDGQHRHLTRLPFNGVFRVDVTEVSLKLRRLPPALDGLSVLVLSDLHLHGTPSRVWFDAVFDELAKLPAPDVIALVGDFLDSDTHHEWLAPLLGKLRWTELGVAILGNHDRHHDPDRLRQELTDLGYTVVSNRWQQVTVRGEPVVLVGQEMPWFRPGPDLTTAPVGPFRLCLSHTPDHFAWAAEHGVDLMLSGHTHGGGIRIPVIGPIFTPCYYGRRHDMGVYQKGGHGAGRRPRAERAGTDPVSV
jgi:predicted MPP superfamily phosphohydrolase